MMKAITLLPLLSLPVSAATVSWDSGGTNTIWETPENWSNDTVPSAGNDYVVDGATVRSPDANSNSFAGDSLLVQNGGVLNLYRTNGGGYFTVNHTINSLTISGAVLRPQSSVGSIGHILTTSVELLGNSSIDLNENSGYTMRLFLNGGITGGGSLNITRDGTGTTRSLSIGGDASGYAGDITFSNVNNSEVLEFGLNHSSGWGTGALTVGDYGNLEFNTDVSNLSGVVSMGTTGTAMLLTDGTSSVIGGLTIGGNSVANGLYDASSLAALGYGGTFTGLGTLRVVPEPSTTLFSGLGGIALLMRRRRHSK